MRLASQQDFNNGSVYTQYRHHEGFAKRARLFPYFPEPILVVGCAFGFLLYEFDKLGKIAYGLEASNEIFEGEWPIEQTIHPRVLFGSILNDADIGQLLDTVGPFGLVIVEDVDPYLTDAEAKIASENCLKLSPIVIHMVTEQGEADLNYHSTGYWMSLTNQLTVSLEGM